ncbi:MAG: Asp23/Gls24 family envelope stress response protein, partial [bacterium]
GNEGVVIELELKLVYGHRLPPLLARVQEEVQERIQYFTGLNVLAVNVLARALQLPEGES